MTAIGPGCTDKYNWIGSTRSLILSDYTMPSNGRITSFCVYMNTSGTVKLQIFRINGSYFDIVGESESKSVSIGSNTGLTCSIDVLSGDLLGIALTNGQLDDGVTGAGYDYIGNVTGSTLITDWTYSATSHGGFAISITHEVVIINAYVDINKADDTGDGLSWATAKKTMNAGYTILDSRGTLHVASGDYSGQTGITYNKSWSLSPEDPNGTGTKTVKIPSSV